MRESNNFCFPFPCFPFLCNKSIALSKKPRGALRAVPHLRDHHPGLPDPHQLHDLQHSAPPTHEYHSRSLPLLHIGDERAAPHAADTAADATGRGQGTSEIYRVRREPTNEGARRQARRKHRCGDEGQHRGNAQDPQQCDKRLVIVVGEPSRRSD